MEDAPFRGWLGRSTAGDLPQNTVRSGDAGQPGAKSMEPMREMHDAAGSADALPLVSKAEKPRLHTCLSAITARAWQW
jgi:hypothetical protein